MRPKIHFSDHELKCIEMDTQLSRLALLGVIAAMNKYCQTDAQIKKAQWHEDMGHNI